MQPVSESAATISSDFMRLFYTISDLIAHDPVNTEDRQQVQYPSDRQLLAPKEWSDPP
jgi:hypothetical protein